MNFNDNFDLKKAKSFLLTERFADKMYDVNPLTGEQERVIYEDEEASLEEMAKIAGDLKSSIEAVIKANPELEGLALKKAIKGDAAVQDALAGDDLYDNQLNKFISLTKGERELGQRGRKADPNKPAAEPREPKAAKVPGEQKIKITTPKSEPSIDAGIEKDSRSKDELLKALKDLKDKRMEVNKDYKAGDESAISKLKDLTVQINKLNKKLGV
jgi:hypothetical protein